MNPLLSLHNVTIGYGKVNIINNISFNAAEGEFCALLGLNGSGKTTLLKGICGLLPLAGGHCFVNEHDVTRMNEKDRARYISYMPQRHSKLIGVTVLDAVMMGSNARLDVFGFPSEKDREAANEALVKMEIPHLAFDDFSRLSEGQKQLVILARTLVQNAPVMLMDEPDSALDFLNKHKTLDDIRKLIYSEKKAGLITLHDPNFALAHCDRLILIKNGALASEIRLSGASANEIQECLSAVYGRIEVSKDHFVSIPRQS